MEREGTNNVTMKCLEDWKVYVKGGTGNGRLFYRLKVSAGGSIYHTMSTGSRKELADRGKVQYNV